MPARSDEYPRPPASPPPPTRISPPRCAAIAQQRLYEAQRDLRPLVLGGEEQDRRQSLPWQTSPLQPAQDFRSLSSRSLDLSSSSSLSLGSEGLEASYYRREEGGARGDQATQTDEEDESPRRRPLRPTSFGCSHCKCSNLFDTVGLNSQSF